MDQQVRLRAAAESRLSHRAVLDAAAVLAYFHALPLTYAVEILEILGLRAKAAYAAIQVLVGAGLAAKFNIRELACANAPGVQSVIVLTSRYASNASCWDLPRPRGPVHVNSLTPRAVIAEHLALIAMLVRRVAAGWLIGHDNGVLARLGAEREVAIRSKWSTNPQMRNPLDPRSWTAPTVEPDQHVTILTPPDGCWHGEGRLPVLLLGGSLTPTRAARESLWRSVAACAPLDVYAIPRARDFRTRTVRVAERHFGWPAAPVAGRVMWGPGSRGPAWLETWTALDRAVRRLDEGVDEAARMATLRGMLHLWETIDETVRPRR